MLSEKYLHAVGYSWCLCSVSVTNRLRSLDLCNNGLMGLPPPAQWSSQGLKEILVSHNRIKKVSGVMLERLPNGAVGFEQFVSHNAVLDYGIVQSDYGNAYRWYRQS